MSMERSKLKEFIDEIIQEIEHDLDEATTSGAAGAYSTPNAFSDGGSKDKKLKKKIATQLGMKLVGKVDEELKEATFRPNSGTMSGGTYGLDNRKYELKRDVKGVRIGDYTNVTLPKGTIIYNIPGGVFAHHRSLKSYESGQNKYFNQSTFRGISVRQEKNTLISIEKNSKILESVNESKKPQGPVNRWLAIKNDETKHPHKKMAMGLKELKYQLGETQKFFTWYNQIKSMNELDSSDYWKRTNKHIYKIKERLINIAKTIQEIEK